MHLYAAFMAGKRKVKYASEMPISEMDFLISTGVDDYRKSAAYLLSLHIDSSVNVSGDRQDKETKSPADTGLMRLTV
jgi:hypothetical protein